MGVTFPWFFLGGEVFHLHGGRFTTFFSGKCLCNCLSNTEITRFSCFLLIGTKCVNKRHKNVVVLGSGWKKTVFRFRRKNAEKRQWMQFWLVQMMGIMLSNVSNHGDTIHLAMRFFRHGSQVYQLTVHSSVPLG